MTTYYNISNATTTQKAVKAGYGILCNNTTMLCNSEEYYCDGSVVFRSVGFAVEDKRLFLGINQMFLGDEGVLLGEGGGTHYDKISY